MCVVEYLERLLKLNGPLEDMISNKCILREAVSALKGKNFFD